MNQEELFQALRAFYATSFDDFGEPEEFTKIEDLTIDQFDKVLKSKWLHYEDLTQEIQALSAYRLVKFKE